MHEDLCHCSRFAKIKYSSKMGNFSSNTTKVLPFKNSGEHNDTKLNGENKILKKWKKLGVPEDFIPVTAHDIMLRINWIMIPAGNLHFLPSPLLGKITLLVWALNGTASFVFDSFEASIRYGSAWATTRFIEGLVLCLGTFLMQVRILKRIELGLKVLEHGRDYSKTLFKMKCSSRRMVFLILGFSICGSFLVYGLLRVDKAMNVSFGQQLPVATVVALHVWRLLSTFQVLYVFALMWLLPEFVMQMTGYAMIEYRESLRCRLRSKEDVLSFREAVRGFKDRIQFANESSSACMGLLTLLFGSALLSLVVNGYVFLYNTRLVLLVWNSLIPLSLSLFPLRTAGWVTKQYHRHIISVVKAWIERPESSSSEDDEAVSDEQEPTNEMHYLFSNENPYDDGCEQFKEEPPSLHIPSTKYESNGQRTQAFTSLLKGSVRTLGRWQLKRRLPKFDFEKYISYLDQVSKETGFSVVGVIVTWELVSSILFFCFSIVALFLQESIFGKLKLAQ